MATSSKANNKKRPFFIVKGKTYLADPDMNEFLREAGVSPNSQGRVKNALKQMGIEEVDLLLSMSERDLSEINQISKSMARVIYKHAGRLQRRGGFLNDYNRLEAMDGEYKYLPTGSSYLDKMMNYSNGKVGWRSKTLIELYGPASSGKTQICLTAAALCMRPVEKGGWGRGVIYIDSEGAFDHSRFKNLCGYWGVEEKTLRKQFRHGSAQSFDDVERIIDETHRMATEIDLGLVIVDSIMDPLKSQYFLGGEYMNNLQPRQQHLKKVLDKLKTLAKLKNTVCIYTNHVRAEIGNTEEKEGPQGGAVMAHASDIRIRLGPASQKEHSIARTRDELEKVGLKLNRAKVVDCGFLPRNEGYYLMGAFGIGDPAKVNVLVKQAEKISKDGFLSINSEGGELSPMNDDTKTRDEIIAEYRRQLYGTA